MTNLPIKVYPISVKFYEAETRLQKENIFIYNKKNKYNKENNFILFLFLFNFVILLRKHFFCYRRVNKLRIKKFSTYVKTLSRTKESQIIQEQN